MDSKEIVKLALSLGVCLTASVIGVMFTISSISDWYGALNKPFFSPPDWIFTPVWTILYILMGLALYLIWRAPKVKHTNEALMLFGAQLIFNIIWPIVFFSFKSLAGSVLAIILLLLLLLLTIARFYTVDKRAAYLLVPYALWVGFATIINVSIYLMNP
jgi:tryptophan-rich sensory protein